jgi:hypothetical protein
MTAGGTRAKSWEFYDSGCNVRLGGVARPDVDMPMVVSPKPEEAGAGAGSRAKSSNGILSGRMTFAFGLHSPHR